MESLIVDDIGLLDREQWDALGADHPAACYDLLCALDGGFDGPPRHRYVVIADGGNYRCAARLTLSSAGEPSFGRVLYGRAAPVAALLGLEIRDAAVCRFFPCHGEVVLADRRLPRAERAALTQALCDLVESAAAGRTIVYADVLPDDSLLVEVLARRGYVEAAGLPIAYLDVQWKDTRGYVETLRRPGRNNTAHAEINRFRRSGAVVERLSGAVDYAHICELLNRHHERLNDESGGHDPQRLGRLHDALADRLTIYAARRSGVVTGVSLALRQGRTATLLWTGIDHEASGPNFTYFNLVFYAPAEDYAKLGVERAWLGNGAYAAKVRRGCRLTSSAVYVLPTRTAMSIVQRPAFALQRAWYRRKFSRLPGVSDV